MRPSHWPIPPVEPCDAMALDGIEDLSEDELAELAGGLPAAPTASQAAAPVPRRRRPCLSGWRHHMPMPSSPGCHFLPCP
jgi:hypothetical protein